MRIRHRLITTWLVYIPIAIFYASVVTAFSVTSPSSNTRIEQGASFLVSWSDLTGNASSLSITVAQGPSADALLVKATLATISSPGTSGSTTVSFPSTIAAADNYFLRLSANTIPTSVAVQGPLGVFVPNSITPSQSSAVPSGSSSVQPTTASSLAPSSSSSAISSVRPSSSASSLPPISSSSATASSSGISSSSSSSSSTSPTPSHASNDDNNSGGSTLSAGGIAGIAIGGVAAAALVFGGAICLRKTGNSNSKNHADTTAAEIFACPPGYKKPPPSSQSPLPRTRSPQLPNMMQNMPPSSIPQGQFYSTGYENHQNYYYGDGAAAAAYDEQQQHYSGYGYHPAAVYMPSLAQFPQQSTPYDDQGYQQSYYDHGVSYAPGYPEQPPSSTPQYPNAGAYYANPSQYHAVSPIPPPAVHQQQSSVPHTPMSPAVPSHPPNNVGSAGGHGTPDV